MTEAFKLLQPLGAAVILGLFAGGATVCAAELAASDELARRGAAAVTVLDVDARLAAKSEGIKAGTMRDPERSGGVVESILLNRQLAIEAERQGLGADPVTEREVQLRKEEVLARLLMQKFSASLVEPDFAAIAEERFRVNRDNYKSPERRVVSHILVTRNVHGDAGAKQRAEEALAKLKLNPPSWNEVAIEYSDEENVDKEYGRLPSLGPGETLADFEKATYELKSPGNISEVVRTRAGYHIIRLEEILPEKSAEFAQVRDKLINQIRAEWLHKKREEFLNSFRAQPLTPHEEALTALRARYGTNALPPEQLPQSEDVEQLNPPPPSSAQGK